MKRFSSKLVFLVVFSFILLPISAQAIPFYGVAPQGPTGTYAGPFEDYLDVFVDDFVSGGDNFIFPADSGLTLWCGRNNGFSLDTTVGLYFATNDTSPGTLTVGGTTTPLVLTTETDQADGYKRNAPGDEYYIASLGSISGPGSLWEEASAFFTAGGGYGENFQTGNPFIDGGKDFRFLNVTYNGSLDDDQWLFLLADENKSGAVFQNGGDRFSPKTTSMSVPEPATVFLLGTGLIGLALLGKTRFKNRKA